MTKTNIIKIVSTYISIILGAGFISGKELYFFFGKYHSFGIFTLFLTSILFIIILNKQLIIIKSNKLEQYHDFSNIVFNKKISSFIETISLFFLFATISTMMSAFCKTLELSFSINIFISQILIFAITLYFIINGIEKIVVLNTFLTPIMFIGIVIISIYILNFNSIETFNDLYSSSKNYTLAFIFSLLYLSFNSLNTIPMMCNLIDYIDSKKTIYFSSIISGLILFILGLLLLFPMIINVDIIKTASLPILTLLNNSNFFIEYIYVLILILAIISTLISSTISFIFTIEKKLTINNNLYLKIITLLLALFLSNLGFENFVNFVYPLFGLLGLVQIYYILKY